MHTKIRRLLSLSAVGVVLAVIAGAIGAAVENQLLTFLALAALIVGGIAIVVLMQLRQHHRTQDLLRRELTVLTTEQVEQREALEGRVEELTAQVLHIVQTAENRAADDSGK